MKTIILNHKMNLYYEDLKEYIQETNKINQNLIIAPSNIYLLKFLENSKHNISSQDICYIEEGNFTSKVSWHQLKSIGIKYSIIGHSEKKENLTKTNKKLKICLSNDIIPILCFGNKNKKQSIKKILNILLKDISNIEKIIFAYEPTYNINNKKIDIENIKNNIDIISNYLKNKYSINPKIMYGGGITKENIKEIYNINNIDGILIGSLSSQINEIKIILKEING